MKLFQSDFGDVAFILNVGLGVGFIDESCTLKQCRQTQRVAHGRNQNDARHQYQVPYAGTGDQPRNSRPEWFAIDLKVIEKSVCFSKIQHSLNKRATPLDASNPLCVAKFTFLNLSSIIDDTKARKG